MYCLSRKADPYWAILFSRFDHQTEETAAEMEAIEIAALAKLGIDNPYQVSDE